MRPDVVVDHEYSDDAAIVRMGGPRDVVLTADVIAPLVDDPEAFGAIAAANSMSDVWAMGGEARFALNLVFFPDDQLDLGVLDAILAGAARVCSEAGVAVPSLTGSWFNDGFHGAMGELICAIEDGREPLNGARDNLASLALAFAAIASAHRGVPVKPGDVRRLDAAGAVQHIA